MTILQRLEKNDSKFNFHPVQLYNLKNDLFIYLVLLVFVIVHDFRVAKVVLPQSSVSRHTANFYLIYAAVFKSFAKESCRLLLSFYTC